MFLWYRAFELALIYMRITARFFSFSKLNETVLSYKDIAKARFFQSGKMPLVAFGETETYWSLTLAHGPSHVYFTHCGIGTASDDIGLGQC